MCVCVGARGCARRRWVAAGLGIQCEDTSELSMLRAAEIPPFTAQKKKKNGNDRNQPLHLFIKTLPRNRVMAEKNNPHPQSPDRRWEKGTQSVLQNGLFRSSDPIEVHWEHRAGRRGRSGCNQPLLWLGGEVSHAWPGWHDG